METSPSTQIDSMLLVLIPMLVGAALFQEGGSEGVAFVPDLSELSGPKLGSRP
jgi:hypothetical protein